MNFIKVINKRIKILRRYIESNKIFKYKAPRWMLWLFILNFTIFSIGNLFAFTISFGKSEKINDLQQIDLAQNSDKYLRIAEKFAPILYQEIEGDGFSDLITNFNYDGDWRGDNNWENLDKFKNSLKPYVYYSVLETETHYFINYSIFHPRDWKGGIISKTLLKFVKLLIAYLDPTQIVKMSQMSHENDLEGMIVVIRKGVEPVTTDSVEYIDIFSHNLFNLFRSENNIFFSEYKTFKLEGSHPVIYIDAKGHGLNVWLNNDDNKRYVVYKIRNTDKNEEKINVNLDINPQIQQILDYDLLNIFDEFWVRAVKNDEQTYGSFGAFNDFSIEAKVGNQKVKILKNFGKVGVAFKGDDGVSNAAMAPWAWREISYSRIYGFDLLNRGKTGEWFFNPAKVLKKRYSLGEDFSEVYLFNPYFGVTGEGELR